MICLLASISESIILNQSKQWEKVWKMPMNWRRPGKLGWPQTPSVSSKPLLPLGLLMTTVLFIFSYLPRASFHLHLWSNRADLPWAQTSEYAKSWRSLLASSATHTSRHCSALGLAGGSRCSHCSPPSSGWWTFLFNKQEEKKEE